MKPTKWKPGPGYPGGRPPKCLEAWIVDTLDTLDLSVVRLRREWRIGGSLYTEERFRYIAALCLEMADEIKPYNLK